MKTCLTCDHLKGDDYTPRCDRIVAGQESKAGTPAFLSRSSRSLEDAMTTRVSLNVSRPDAFGCSLHTPKAVAPKIPGELWGVFRKSDGELVLHHFGLAGPAATIPSIHASEAEAWASVAPGAPVTVDRIR